MLETRPTRFSDVVVVVPDVHSDRRGFFKEVFSQSRYDQLGIHGPFVQDNVSRSRRGVLRGMHYDMRMAKLVQCLEGAIYDVVVDMRELSATYKQWDAVELTGDNHWQMYVPAGFAHGFYVLSDHATVHYKQTALYDPAQERGVHFRDATIGIDWPFDGKEPLVSPKDGAL